MSSAAPSHAHAAPARFVVALGASAGGIEALRPLVTRLEPNGACAYVVAQHMAPSHASALAELLGRETSLDLAAAIDGDALVADRIYVTPPDRDVLVRDGRLVLRPPGPSGPRPCIDVLLDSLASEVGERAVAVILSGTGTDGTHGSRAVKAAGGLVIVQHPRTARHDGMPGSVLRAGLADLELEVVEIADRLSALDETTLPRLARDAIDPAAHEQVTRLLDLIYRATRLDFSQYKESTLLRQIERRMRALGLASLATYLAHCEAHASELAVLQQSFLISVTSFFRDRQVFDGLRRALGELVGLGAGAGPRAPLRIWVPGCATGEEAYSVGILLAELVGPELFERDVKIFATDIDVAATDIARAGCYAATALAGLDPALVERWFTRDGDVLRIVKRIRDLCIFSRHDLTRDPPFLRMDLIACRNVLIYFKPSLQADVLEKLHYALVPSGLLVLGRSESPASARHLFAPLDSKLKLFRRQARHTPRPMRRPQRLSPPPLPMPPPVAPTPGPGDVVRDALIDAYAPPSVLLGPGLEPLHFHGAVGRYLRIPSGEADFSILSLCPPALRAELEMLLLRVAHGGVPLARSHALELALDDGHAAVQLTARVVGASELGGERPILLTFQDASGAVRGGAPPAPDEPVGDGDATRRELIATREHLAAVRSQLATTNAEFRALTEEVQASTEELQASNEELQTTNEELHAANEELTTLNDELQARTSELAASNDTLSAIQSAIPVGMVLVDHKLRVLRFNPLAVRVFGLMTQDVGHNLLSLPCHLEGVDLRATIGRVLETSHTVAEHVRAGDNHWLMQVSAYVTAAESSPGAMLTFADVTELRRVEEALYAHERRFRTIYDTVPTAIWREDWSAVHEAVSELAARGLEDLGAHLRARPELVDELRRSLRVVDANRAALALFEVSAAEATGSTPSLVFGPPTSSEAFVAAVVSSVSGRRHAAELEVRTRGGEARTVLVSMRGPWGADAVDTSAEHLALVTALDVSALRRAERELSESEDRFDVVLEATPNAVLIVDERGVIVRANRKSDELFGWPAGALRGVEVEALLPAAARDRHRAARAGYHAQPHARPMGIGTVLDALRKDGERFDAEVSLAPMRVGERRYVIANVLDVTERLAAERDLRAREEKYRLVVDTTPDGFIMVDATGRILEVNDAYARRSGYSTAELLRMTTADLARPDEADEARSRIQRLAARGSMIFEAVHRSKSGELWPVEVTATWAPIGGGRMFGFVRDITERRKAEDEIRSLAYYDVLTGLPNRRLLLERLRQAMAASDRHGHYCALLFIDLDNFKLLNDTLGHEVGDRLLGEVARRLQVCLRKGDTVARLGGDEFVVMLEGLDPRREGAAIQAEAVATKVLRALSHVHELAAGPRHCTASIGISLFTRHELSVDELLKQTDLAMYQAKGAGRNALRFFDAEMQASVESRARLEAELVAALRHGQLVLHYQPQVDARGDIVGAEALVRWSHPTRGTVMPGDFIPLAEGSNLILPLGAEVMRQACATLARWAAQPALGALTLSVNVSARQFRAPDFVRQVQSALEASGALAQRLKLELTESILVEDVSDTRHKMMALRALGVTFSLDDFGTGYSSLSYLKRLPLDQIKIDRSFVSDILSNPSDAVIARAVVALGNSLGLKVMAEGVETPEQWRFLLAHGCHEGQGYLFGRPVELSELEAKLSA